MLNSLLLESEIASNRAVSSLCDRSATARATASGASRYPSSSHPSVPMLTPWRKAAEVSQRLDPLQPPLQDPLQKSSRSLKSIAVSIQSLFHSRVNLPRLKEAHALADSRPRKDQILLFFLKGKPKITGNQSYCNRL